MKKPTNSERIDHLAAEFEDVATAAYTALGRTETRATSHAPEGLARTVVYLVVEGSCRVEQPFYEVECATDSVAETV